MSKILVIGGTGYAGQHIAKEAHVRNHEVKVLSRSKPEYFIEGVEYIQGSADNAELVSTLLKEVDVVVAAASPRGNMAGKLAPVYAELSKLAAEHSKRLLIVGGFSSLRPTPGAPRFFESGDIPEAYKAEALELASVVDQLYDTAPDALDWLFVSPAAEFGAYAEVADTGTYRVGTDVALFDEKGDSKISGADFALGIVNEIENQQHHNANISIAQ